MQDECCVFLMKFLPDPNELEKNGSPHPSERQGRAGRCKERKVSNLPAKSGQATLAQTVELIAPGQAVFFFHHSCSPLRTLRLCGEGFYSFYSKLKIY
jgi:hypothetical protein